MDDINLYFRLTSRAFLFYNNMQTNVAYAHFGELRYLLTHPNFVVQPFIAQMRFISRMCSLYFLLVYILNFFIRASLRNTRSYWPFYLMFDQKFLANEYTFYFLSS